MTYNGKSVDWKRTSNICTRHLVTNPFKMKKLDNYVPYFILVTFSNYELFFNTEHTSHEARTGSSRPYSPSVPTSHRTRDNYYPSNLSRIRLYYSKRWNHRPSLTQTPPSIPRPSRQHSLRLQLLYLILTTIFISFPSYLPFKY